MPTSNVNQIDTKTIIGRNAKKPLVLDIPIMITGMSYGGSLSLQIKMVLAKGAAMAGTSMNTGESAVTNEERDSAKYLIGQYNRGSWLNTEDQLQQLDAIEAQLGQGAFDGAVESTVKKKQWAKALQTQMAIALPQAPPLQIALYIGKLNDKLDINKAANHLSNFLKSCIAEMKLVVQAVGKNAIKELDRSDLVTVDKELAEFVNIRYAASHRRKHQNEYIQPIKSGSAEEEIRL